MLYNKVITKVESLNSIYLQQGMNAFKNRLQQASWQTQEA